MNFRFRKAELDDLTRLEKLIEKSAKNINAAYYSDEEVNAALGKIWTVDIDLIIDNTYWVVENVERELVACGGWSKRNILYGKKESANSSNDEINPTTDSARIRAFFVLPKYTRMGIGKGLLERCEKEATMMGFQSFELVATLSGEKLYSAFGYITHKKFEIDLGNGIKNKVVSMHKSIL